MSTYTQIIQAMDALSPTYLSLVNESQMHAGYFEGKESHFKLTLVSHAFESKRLAARHQLIYGQVLPLLTSGGGSVHALAIHAYTPAEWADTLAAPDSPLCAGRNRE